MKHLKRISLIIILIALLIGTHTSPASAKSGDFVTHIGIVTASALNLRSEPSTTSQILSYAPQNDYVIVTGRTGSWLRVNYNLISGYMHEAYINRYTAKNVELGYGRITGNKVNLRSGPGTSYPVVAQSKLNEKAYIIGFNNQWYKVIYKDHICYIRSDFLELTEIPYENKLSLKSPIFFVGGKSTGVSPSAQALSGSSTAAIKEQIISNAKKHIGTPYLWGGNTPGGFDCSGFTQYIFKQSGITLPRTTTEQYQVGTAINKNDLQPGDLVFLANTYRSGISHVGIYIGSDKMIHASSSKGITISDLSSSYYVQHYYGSRRIIK